MDIFQIPRNLLFENRRSLAEFDVRDERSLDSRIANLLRSEFSIRDGFLGLFNETYYVCTLVMLDASPDSHIHEYQRIASGSTTHHVRFSPQKRARMVLGMVYTYLKCIASASDAKYRRFRESLSRVADIDYAVRKSEDLYDYIPDSVFSPRRLTKELLEEADWNTLTNGFQPEEALKIQNLLGRNVSERMMVFDAIVREAQNQEMRSSKRHERVRALKEMKNRLSDPRYSFRDDEEEKETDTQITERVNVISEKIGEATVPLKVLVDGIKKRAQLKGLDAAMELFEHLNNILYDIPEWHKNVPGLEQYFIEAREKREAKERGILMTGEHATYNENNNK